jgi:hypothetical protein
MFFPTPLILMEAASAAPRALDQPFLHLAQGVPLWADGGQR